MKNSEKKREILGRIEYKQNAPKILKLVKKKERYHQRNSLEFEYQRLQRQIKRARNGLKVLIITGAAYAGFLTFVLIKTI